VRKNRIIAWTFALMIAFTLPCAAASLQRSVASMLDDLARTLPAQGERLTRIGIGLLPIEDASPLARRYEVGSAASTLLRQAVSRSLVFNLVDSKTIDAALRTLEKELADGTAPASSEALSEEVEYFIVGSVTQEGELFRIVLRLVETSTTATFATVESTFPVTDLVALGESLSKPFAYIGPFGTIAWDTESPKGGTYGPFLYSTGISALLPLKTMYAKLGLEYLGAAGAQSESYLGKTYGLPPSASGTNTLQSLFGFLGFGLFMPIRYGIYGKRSFLPIQYCWCWR
jgi:TolB-like protein